MFISGCWNDAEYLGLVCFICTRELGNLCHAGKVKTNFNFRCNNKFHCNTNFHYNTNFHCNTNGVGQECPTYTDSCFLLLKN